MSDFQSYYQEKIDQFEAYLKEAFPRLPEEVKGFEESMRYSLFAGGKRLRPILLLTCLEAAGGRVEWGLPFAAALECIHTYSLIHDDLPCMDNDELRRGKPTNHMVYGENIALLAGDGLLTEAFAWAADPAQALGLDPHIRLQAIFALASKAGNQGMVIGQVADMQAERTGGSKELLDFIHFNKTGQLITAALEIGGLLAGLNRDQLAHLVAFGEGIGKAFQIQDDILDVTGSDHELGKPAGSDEKNQKLTYPKLHGLEESKVLAEETLNQALAELAASGVEGVRLAQLADFVLRRSS